MAYLYLLGFIYSVFVLIFELQEIIAYLNNILSIIAFNGLKTDK